MDTRPTLNREQRRKLEKAKRLQTKKVKKLYDNLAPQVKQQVYKKMYEKRRKKKMKDLWKETLTYKTDNEEEAMSTIEDFKSRQMEEGYTLTKYKTDYKVKKDKKTGEILDETWTVMVEKTYEVM